MAYNFSNICYHLIISLFTFFRVHDEYRIQYCAIIRHLHDPNIVYHIATGKKAEPVLWATITS